MMNFDKTYCRTALSALALIAAMTGASQAQTAADAPATAMTMEQIETAYKAGDLAAVRAGLLPFAEKGEALAQYRLGLMMANALGGDFDRAGAINWLEAALSSGHESDQLLLARVYLTGQPEEPEFTRAAELLTKEVEGGSAEAHQYLAGLYRVGRGVEGNAERAFELFRKAADANLPASQFAVSQMYSRGEGVAQDDAQAARWLLQAADNGYIKAQMSLHFNYLKGSGFPRDPQKAYEWLGKAVAGGDILAKRIMGSALLFGEDIEADPVRGIALLVEAGEAGEAGAQNNLGYAYATGTGVAQNDRQAAVWYQKAADQGLTRAADVVGDLYLSGRGVEEDLERAEHYYRIGLSGRSRHSGARLGQLMAAGAIDPDAELELAYELVPLAAENGDEAALDWVLERGEAGEPYMFYRLGKIYVEGLGVEADTTQGAAYLKKAADGKILAAQEELSALYATGDGVEQDYAEAHKWANVAAANGSEAGAEQRDVLAALMTPEQVAEAQKRARNFMARP